MRRVTHRQQSTESVPALYMAFELGATKWQIACGTWPGGAMWRRRVTVTSSQAMAGVVTALIAQAKTAFELSADAPVRSCYEAGRDGFWVHRLLATCGVENVMVDSSSIEVNRRARQSKTDRLDATKLLRMLMRYWGGERDVWHVVRVPSVAEEDARQLPRWLGTLTKERTRWRNRMHAALMLHGVRLAITPRLPEQLTAARDWNGQPLPPRVVAVVLGYWTQLQQVAQVRRAVRRQLRTTLRQAETASTAWARRVHQLRAVGKDSALVLAHEIFGRGLRNRRQVGGLTGLAPVPHQSGEQARDRGISRSGNRRVRGLAIELAWAWVQWQPTSALTAWYQQRWGRHGPRARRIGIVALARKLLIALWRYGDGGLLPRGALLRAAV